MKSGILLRCLYLAWREYLAECGHDLERREDGFRVIRSRQSWSGRYRWLLLISKCPVRVLRRSEQARIRLHLERAQPLKEAVYLVVGFVNERGHIIILPARNALKAGCIRSDVGGVDWDV